MAHGYPDWGIFSPKKTVYALQDMAELVARLGSIVTFNRRGDVIWLDDFESGIGKWGAVLQGTGAGVVNTTETARNGAYSVKLTTGNAADDWAFFAHPHAYPVFSRLGFEISFALDSAIKDVRIFLVLYTGTTQHVAEIVYIHSTGELQYRDQNNVYQTFTTITPLRVYSKLFHTGKLVIDPANTKYYHLILNSQTFDLSAYSYFTTSSPTYPYMEVAIRVATPDAVNRSIYVDDAIITQNEP